MRTVEKIYAVVVADWLHLFAILKVSAGLFPLGGIRDADITPPDLGPRN